MFFTLLKGYLFSNGIGLVSHGILYKGIGIYGNLVLMIVSGILMNHKFRLLVSKRYVYWNHVFISIFNWDLIDFQWNVLRTLPSVSLLKVS